ncbi:bifunctional phosphopantothenoylcysteine decarboxylase/phosphopantothenate--cysteine ligase CoaBC [Alkalibacterium sp. s-m-22]
MINGKKIALYVTGGIAVYKAVDLLRELIKNGAEVRVAMTKGAAEFVTPLTFQILSKHTVYIDTFSEDDPSIVNHINLADWADYSIVAPLTANTLAKMAHGLADNFVTSALLAVTHPVFTVPAMNGNMYRNTVTQENIEKLSARGIVVMSPDTGFLAEGYSGEGRFPEKSRIIDELEAFIRDHSEKLPLRGKKIIVTAGGTKERIDPVRYITNDSSGKMGHALAVEAWKRGAEVVLISASQLATPDYITRVPVESAEEMLKSVTDEFDDADAVIMAAAVSDYAPATVEKQKMKKKDSLTLSFRKNPDILKSLGEKKKPDQLLIGFAAETEDLIRYAEKKLNDKNADLIIANDVGKKDRGFNVDENEVTMLSRKSEPVTISLRSKSDVSVEVIDWLVTNMN